MTTLNAYYEATREIISSEPITGLPSSPTQLLPHLYIGALRHAESLATLKRYKISHVLNVAAPIRNQAIKSPYEGYQDDLIYSELPIEDKEDYEITKHFREAFSFIDKAKRNNGITLVHCQLGINRSATICIAYLMQHKNWSVLKTLQYVKDKRHILLSNKGFRKQLINWASCQNKLDKVNSHPTLQKLLPSNNQGDKRLDTYRGFLAKYKY